MIRPAPGLTITQQPEAVLRRCCLWAEARGEPVVGRLAVAWVIRNRAQKLGISESAVILAPAQFSSFDAHDVNRPKLLSAYELDPTGWAAVDAICELFEQNYTTDPTKGSRFYYNPKTASPRWGRGHEAWQEHIALGSHVFGVNDA